MKEPTAAGLRALAKLDGTIPPLNVDRAINELRGRTKAGLFKTKPLDTVMSRAEAAEALHVCTKTVDKFARNGTLERVMLTEKRAIGLSRESVEKAVARREGKVV